jgi:hypothetical protein
MEVDMSRLGYAALVCLAVPVAATAAVAKVGPTWSEVTGAMYSRAKMNRQPAVIKAIDDDDTTLRVVKVPPGEHVIRLNSSMRKGIQGSDQDLKLMLEPCKRYYLNAQFESGGAGADWKPVVDYVETLTGCKVPK